MRSALVALALFAAACGQSANAPAETAGEDASAGSTGVGRVPGEAAPAFTLESEALVGLWSFDRSCGLYDLALNADDTVTSDNIAGENTYSEGAWAIADANRVVLTMRIASAADESRVGEAQTYHLDVTQPVTDDLHARLSHADGSQPQDIMALRCPEEDRD
ncbi:MAG: hypothetical protein AB7J28_12715 [Hyphomonadaceae bacterium]